MTTAARTPAERAHYADFYDPAGDGRGDDRPRLVVVGNCQAESLRLLMASDDVRTVRVPPVHELGPGDVEPLHRLLRATDLLVSQPVADDYHGLPLGTAQQQSLLPSGARAVVVPTLRYAGLHPWQVVVHPPHLVDPVPPVVAYHDLRTVTRAAWRRAGREPASPADVTTDAVLAVAALSVAELERRERRAGAVVVSDLLQRPSATTVRTVNHPGNELLSAVAARLREALGLPPRPPGTDRPLLTEVVAPLEPVVLRAHGLTDPPREHWLVRGAVVPDADVVSAQLSWYERRPDVLDAVLERSAEVRTILGLPGPSGSAGGA